MKRPHCKTCHNRMKGHKRRRCSKNVIIILDNDNIYNGSVYNDIPSGTGTLTSINGLRYTGSFKNGKKHGYGVEVRDDGYSYIGDWVDGDWCGQGKLTLSNGNIYQGSFTKSLYNGKGKLIKTDGYTYDGDWLNGIRHGHGVEQKSTEKYVGEFFNNYRHGHGSCYNQNGNTYIGQWRRGFRQGNGRETTPLSVYSGNWVRGKRSGHGQSISVIHGEYTGRWRDGKRHGVGVNILDDVVYNGNWKNGMCHGMGTLFYENGHYCGSWYENEYHGNGELFENGTTFTGKWEYGHRQGEFQEKTGTKIYKGTYENDVRHGTFVELGQNKSELYIWGLPTNFKTNNEARNMIKSLMRSDDYIAAIAVAEYINIVNWNLLYKHDTNGILLKFIDKDIIKKKFIKYAWKLFKKKRYIFLETMIANINLHEFDSLLFDCISKTFVANPWIIREQSYSEDTKKKLLEGLHLGDFGRCPPKDPFTRQFISEKSGKYLAESKDLAKKIYKKFICDIQKNPSVREMAYSFDMEDFETMLKNAREANDRDTIRKLLKERSVLVKNSNIINEI